MSLYITQSKPAVDACLGKECQVGVRHSSISALLVRRSYPRKRISSVSMAETMTTAIHSLIQSKVEYVEPPPIHDLNK
jgi:hypothetical protein